MKSIFFRSIAMAALVGLAACSSNQNGPVDIGPVFQSGSLYVANTAANSISIFAAGAPSGSGPSNIIGPAGSTGLAAPQYLAVDAANHLYSTNRGTMPAIIIFAANATGVVIPLATYSGSATTLAAQLSGITVDSAGSIYVAQYDPVAPASSVLVFSGATAGNVAPARTISGALTGLNIPIGVALDNTANLYVSNSGNASITVYAPAATGNVAPTATIIGASTLLVRPTGITTDAARNLYVADSTANAIYVFGPGANGNVAPIRTIAGAATMLASPTDVKLGAGGNIYVADSANGKILVFPAAANGNVAPSLVYNDPNVPITGIALTI